MGFLGRIARGAAKMGGDFLLFVFDSRDNYSGWRSDCA